jgi:triosephosphate isomerase
VQHPQAIVTPPTSRLDRLVPKRVASASSALSPGALQLAIDADVSVVLCVGESLAEREAGHTLQVVTRQLQAVAAVVPAAHWASRIVIAYEPVWAIGTGKVASAEQAQEAHAAIRAWLADKVSAEAAAGTRIVYGGSVNVSRWACAHAPVLARNSCG